MGAQIVLVFRTRLPLHQCHIVLERHDLPMQPFDGDRLGAFCWLLEVEALLGSIDPAGDQVFRSACGSHSSHDG